MSSPRDNQTTRRMRARLLAATLCALPLGAARAAADLTATFADGHLDVPQVYAGEGYHPILLLNDADQPATFTFFRLKGDATVADFREANDALMRVLGTNGDEAPAVARLMADASALSGTTVAAHSQFTMYADLEEGAYVFAVNPDPNAQAPHLDYASTMVVESGAAVPAPKAQHVLHLADFAFDVPSKVDAGDELWEVTNVGAQPHIAVFFKLLPGKTAEDLKAALSVSEPSGPPPFDESAVVEVEALTPGAKVYLPLDFTPGEWVAVCMVQDMNNPKVMHFMEGMLEEFTVS